MGAPLSLANKKLEDPSKPMKSPVAKIKGFAVVNSSFFQMIIIYKTS